MTSNLQQSVEERVARHLAAKDWLVEPGSAWARRGKKFHEDYLAAAREVIAIVREGAASPVGQPARAGAALRDRIAETLTTTLSRMDVMAWLGCRRGDRDHDVSITQTELGRTLADAVLAVFPEPPSRAASLSDAERQFLTFALDLAADEMASRGDEFGAEDQAALDSLRRLAAGAQQQPETEAPVLVETLARLLCDAENTLTDGPSWDRLSQTPGLGRDEYRNAARYLLRRVTVKQTVDGPAEVLCGDEIPGMTCTLPDGPHDDWRHRDEQGHWWSQMRVPPYSNRDRLAAERQQPAAADSEETRS